MQTVTERDIIISIREVEPGLVAAVKRLSATLGRPLRGVTLVDKGFVDNKHRVRDETGFFEEVICDFNDPDALQRAIKPLSNRILTATCRFETAIQDFRKAIPFMPYIATPTESSLAWSTEKILMRDRLHAYDESLTPKYVYLTSVDSGAAHRLVRDFEFPVIVKPNGLYASLLVSRCEDQTELEACLERTFDVIHEIYDRENGTGEPSVLVEEMMQGDMYSVDAYVTPTGEVHCLPLVKVVTAHSIGKPGFYSYRHIIPTGLSDQEVAAANKTAIAAVHALNLRASTAHIEMFHTSHGWKVIELGPRIGGYREGLYGEAYGIDHYYNDLAVRIGAQLEIPTVPIKHAAGINIYAEKEGIITAISGIDQARRLESVVFLEAHAQVGDRALFAGSGGELIVDAILSNKDPEQLERDVAQVRELVTIQVAEKSSLLVVKD
jgi:biotin carboxylase